MDNRTNPQWWTKDYDSAWERVKAAFARDWDQTKHHFGADVPDTDQNVADTVSQAAGKDAIPPRGEPVREEDESAYRYGYGARMHYGSKYNTWNDDLEKNLRSDWDTTYPSSQSTWERNRDAVRRGWDYTDKTDNR